MYRPADDLERSMLPTAVARSVENLGMQQSIAVWLFFQPDR
jgi:hypothetical protein